MPPSSWLGSTGHVLASEARRKCHLWLFLLVSDLLRLLTSEVSVIMALIMEAYYNSGFEVFDKSNFWVSEELMDICLISENN